MHPPQTVHVKEEEEAWSSRNNFFALLLPGFRLPLSRDGHANAGLFAAALVALDNIWLLLSQVWLPVGI